jgi:HAD superfamily hydrolase (TIGR01509 family)
MYLDKPHPMIFQEVVRQTGIAANDTLFIDDLEANCQAAHQSVGWHVYQNKHFDDWLQLLV